jgi:Ca-activated chloride channel family protein
VKEPGGAVVYHTEPKSPAGGLYLYDNTTGRGPEHYLLHKAVPGKYKVGVHLHGGTPSVAEVEVILFEETPRERRLKATVRLEGKVTAVWPLEFEVP